MMWWRMLHLSLHLVLGLAICALRFPFIDGERRGRYIRWFSRRLLRVCGIHLHMPHHPVHEPAALVVANHVSWLDIFVLNALYPCQFVAKLEIRGWPLLGWLSHQAGTVFIARGKRRDVRRVFEGLVAHLQAGQRVAFFPEGVVASQGKLLPFHANLFEAAIDAKVPVQPYALVYRDGAGQYHPAVEYAGDISFRHSLFAVLRAEAIHAEVLAVPMLPSQGVLRRELAVQAQAAIGAALGLPAATAAAPAPDQADDGANSPQPEQDRPSRLDAS